MKADNVGGKGKPSMESSNPSGAMASLWDTTVVCAKAKDLGMSSKGKLRNW